MEGNVIVQARSAHRDSGRPLEWERFQVFAVAPEVVEEFGPALRVLTPEEIDEYMARGGPPPKFLDVPPVVKTTTASADAEPVQVETRTLEGREEQRTLDAPEYNRSMEGRSTVRRRNG